MRQKFYAIAALCFFAIVPAQADIVDVTVNGTLAASGHAFAKCNFTINSCQGYLGNASIETFSFGGSTNESALSFNGSAFASADGGRVTVSAMAGQTNTVAPENLSIDFQSSAVVNAFGGQWGASFMSNNSDTVTFDLATQTLIHLTVQETSEAAFVSRCVSLMGPYDFSASWGCPFSGAGPLRPVDQSLFLVPGAYTLSADERVIGQISVFDAHQTISDDFLVDLQVVPEPVWIAIFPALVVIAWHRVSLRRRGRQESPVTSLRESSLRSR